MINGKCTKHFPKIFYEETIIDEEGFPVYRRRNDGITIEKNGILLDNWYVVPYNVDLLLKYQSHLNVEWCNRSRSIKYLFKYINKGLDRATVVVEENLPNIGSDGQETNIVVDGEYLNFQFSFDIHLLKDYIFIWKTSISSFILKIQAWIMF